MSAERKKTLRTVLAAALVAVPALGGLAWTGITVAGADTTARTVVWKERPVVVTDEEAPLWPQGRHDTPMTKQLLPVPDGYRLGPDIGKFGNDAELSGEEAESLLKTSGAGLPGGSGSAKRDFVQKLDVQGLGLRSYSKVGSGLVVEMRVWKMKNRKAVRELGSVLSQIDDVLSVFRDGPEIEGHEHARCYLPPEDDESGLEQMFCSAYQDDLLVVMQVTAAKPLHEDDAAELLKDQLDRLASGGGTYV